VREGDAVWAAGSQRSGSHEPLFYGTRGTVRPEGVHHYRRNVVTERLRFGMSDYYDNCFGTYYKGGDSWQVSVKSVYLLNLGGTLCLGRHTECTIHKSGDNACETCPVIMGKSHADTFSLQGIS
jgi:hypothetical protein